MNEVVLLYATAADAEAAFKKLEDVGGIECELMHWVDSSVGILINCNGQDSITLPTEGAIAVIL